jgi:hypothetical protein
MITRAERAALAQAGVAALLGQIPEPRAELPGQLALPGLPPSPEAEAGPQLPTPADLDAATAATAAAIADRTATRAEVERLAEAEAATYAACPDYPSLYDPEAEAEPGPWAAEYEVEPEAGR